MSAWLNPPTVFFAGEDEEGLKAEFVRVSARYPDRNCFEVGAYVFRQLRDGATRGNQAGKVWSEDLEVQERIRQFRINGGETARDLSDKEQTAREVLALAQQDGLDAKDRIAAYKLYGEICGYIVKQELKKSEGKPGLPTYEIARYDD